MALMDGKIIRTIYVVRPPASHLPRRLGKDALLTIFATSIEITFLIEFKPFPGV